MEEEKISRPEKESKYQRERWEKETEKLLERLEKEKDHEILEEIRKEVKEIHKKNPEISKWVAVGVIAGWFASGIAVDAKLSKDNREKRIDDKVKELRAKGVGEEEIEKQRKKIEKEEIEEEIKTIENRIIDDIRKIGDSGYVDSIMKYGKEEIRKAAKEEWEEREKLAKIKKATEKEK